MKEYTLSGEDKKILLSIARNSIKDKFGPEEIPGKITAPLQEKLGAFVTLKKNGKLRGCIGTFEAKLPLYKTVEKMAKAAAFSDPRFPALREEELPEIEIEISVLTPLSEIKPEDVKIGKDGLKISKGIRSGVLLPQVPLEWGWDRKEFLRQVCRKAGLPPEAHKNQGAKLEKFEAVIFSE